MKRIIILFLTLCLLLSFSACSLYSLMMKPDDYTAISYNIVWTQCKEKIESDDD